MAQNYYSGIEAGRKMYLQGLQKYGFHEGKYREKTVNTCWKYAKDESIKKTKKGVVLTPSMRKFYQGIADYLQAPNRIVY